LCLWIYRCHVFVSGAALLVDSTDATGRWSCSAHGFDRCHRWMTELLYSWTREMPQVGEAALPLDLTDAQVAGGAAVLMNWTDAAGRWNCFAPGFDRCTGGWRRLLVSWTLQMLQIGGGSALGFYRCHLFVSGDAFTMGSTDATGGWCCSSPGFDRCHRRVAELLVSWTL
jgi:hypothetical protein